MTEVDIIYSILEVIRGFEVTDDEKVTEDFLRDALRTYRADVLKDLDVFTEDMFQDIKLQFEVIDSKKFVCKNYPHIIFAERNGIQITDYYGEIPIVPKQEALNASKGRFFKPKFIGYISNSELVIFVNNDVLGNGINPFDSKKPELDARAILVNPSDAPDYDYRTSNFPLSTDLLKKVKQAILRQEFGLSLEVKKDETQNSRQDNVIYQDESKLYK